MPRPEQLIADDQWEKVTGRSFKTFVGRKRVVHLRGKGHLTNYIMHHQAGGYLLVYHRSSGSGTFSIISNKGQNEQAEAKQFAEDHNRESNNG